MTLMLQSTIEVESLGEQRLGALRRYLELNVAFYQSGHDVRNENNAFLIISSIQQKMSSTISRLFLTSVVCITSQYESITALFDQMARGYQWIQQYTAQRSVLLTTPR